MDKRQHLKFNKYEWDCTPKILYKGSTSASDTFYNVTRQNIAGLQDKTDFEVRYFECGDDGYTTLEKHEHVHIVMILRGQGKVIIGETIYEAKPFDFFVIPSWLPHQFINTSKEAFGFICCVNARRDKYTLLTEEEANHLHDIKDIHKYIKIPEGYFENEPSCKA